MGKSNLRRYDVSLIFDRNFEWEVKLQILRVKKEDENVGESITSSSNLSIT